MYTIPDENYTLNDLDKTVGDLGYLKIVQAPGITLEIDGVECYGIHGYIFSYKNQYIPTGNAIFVDKNHDISWYFAGSDFVGKNDESEDPRVIDRESMYGYEWGSEGLITGINAIEIGISIFNGCSYIVIPMCA